MEISFNQLKKMDVVSVTDGKNLGKVCDIAFFFPEGHIKGIFVTGSKGFHFTKSDEFIPFKKIVKIGEDVILVKFGEEAPPPKPSPNRPPNQVCPPPCPPCPPNFPPNHGNFGGDPRRSFDDYE